MPLKKVGIVSAGVTAALLTASPLAFAGDYPEGGKSATGPEVKGASTNPGKGPSGPSGPSGPAHPGHGGVNLSKSCEFVGGNGVALAGINGNATVGNIVAQVPVAGNNIAQLANCSDFLNNNLNNNLSGNRIAIASGLLG